MKKAVEMIKAAKRPMILCGRSSRSQEIVGQRACKLAEALGACVMSDLKNGAAFPTDHPAHVIEPFNQPAEVAARDHRAKPISSSRSNGSIWAARLPAQGRRRREREDHQRHDGPSPA